MKYCLSMCLTLLLLSTLEIISLLQRALPSSLIGCTTFWQTQVCVCVCMYEVGMCGYACVCVHACVPVNEWVGRQTCVHTCVQACMRTWVCACMLANLSCVPLITTIYTWIVLVHCACRCCCCYCILPNWVTCHHTSHSMAIWSHWYRFIFYFTFICTAWWCMVNCLAHIFLSSFSLYKLCIIIYINGIPKHAQLAPSLCNHLAQLLVRVHRVISQDPACLSNIGGRATCTWYLVHDNSCLMLRDAFLWAHQHLLQCHVWPEGDSHSQRGWDASYHLWDTSHVGECHTWASSFLLLVSQTNKGGSRVESNHIL